METSLVLHRDLTTMRDLRVSRRGVQCRTHRFTSMRGAKYPAAVGRTHQGRYGRKLGAVPALERVFRRTMHSRLYFRNIAIHVDPRVALSFCWLQQMGRYFHPRERVLERVFPSGVGAEHHESIHQVFHSPEGVLERVFPLRHASERPEPICRVERLFLSGLPERHESIRQVLSTVNRLTERFRRIDGIHRQESFPSAMGTSDRERERSHTQPAKALWPVVPEIVLKRGAAVVPAVRQEDTLQAMNPDKSRFSLDKEKGLAQPVRSFSLAEFTPNELQRLTDQVVTRLDHRVIAMRERLGRT